MALPFLETTAPAAAQTTDARGQVPMLALLIVQCEKEPWRVGQYALRSWWSGLTSHGQLGDDLTTGVHRRHECRRLPEQATRTALGAARHRAAHQTLERGRIFSDPLAVRILGSEAEPLNPNAENEVARRGLRLFIAARTRFAEDALVASVPRGLRQVVVLGAGLDTYAYRSPTRRSLSRASSSSRGTYRTVRPEAVEIMRATSAWSMTRSPVSV